MKGNGSGTRNPQEIQREIDRTRSELDATLNAIEHRLTPGQLLDQGIDYLRHSGAKQYITNFGGSMKDNPIPSTLVGIGLAWLAAMQNRPVQYRFVEVEKKSAEHESYDTGPSAVDRMHQGLDTAKGRMHEGMATARSRVHDGMNRISNQAQRVKGGWDNMITEHPLALGAIGLAIGAVAAAMQPRTRTEDEMFGAARDRMLDDAKQMGTEKLQQAKDAAVPKKETESVPESKDGSMNPPSFTSASGVNLDNGPRRPS